jgi:hypothetical protein
LRVIHGCRVHAHLVGAGIQEAPYILDLAHAATDGERNEDLLGTGLDDVQDDVALIRTRGDI